MSRTEKCGVYDCKALNDGGLLSQSKEVESARTYFVSKNSLSSSLVLE